MNDLPFMKAFEDKEKKIIFDKNWVFQRKYDGSRHFVLRGDIGSSRSINRNNRFPHIAKELEKIKDCGHMLDCEIYIPGGTVLDLNASKNWHKAKMCVFDVLDYNNKTFEERSLIVKDILKDVDENIIHYPVEFEDYKTGWQKVIENNWEGLMAKYKKGLYHHRRRTKDWIKIKRHSNEDAEIIGHEAGSTKGTFLIKFDDGVEQRLSGTSVGIVNDWKTNNYKRCEVAYLYKTKDNRRFQPRFVKFVGAE